MAAGKGGTAAERLTPRGHRAAVETVRRVRMRVAAELVQAVLFGSYARGEARPDSDVDVLLVFRDLPPDREPQAGHAEAVAEEVAAETGVPVQVWSVSLADLACGWRTPMLVDSLEDGVPLWPAGHTVPRLRYTAADAGFCARQLLARVEEGGREVARLRAGGDAAWHRRVRDDLVRLCTAALLLRGETRPRRAAAVRRFLEREHPRIRLTAADRAAMAWAARSFGPGRGDEDRPVPPPPVSFGALASLVDRLRAHLAPRIPRSSRRP